MTSQLAMIFTDHTFFRLGVASVLSTVFVSALYHLFLIWAMSFYSIWVELVFVWRPHTFIMFSYFTLKRQPLGYIGLGVLESTTID